MSEFRQLIEIPNMGDGDVEAAIDSALGTCAGTSAKALSNLMEVRRKDRLHEELALSPLGAHEKSYLDFYEIEVLVSAEEFTPHQEHRDVYHLTLAHALTVFDTVQVRKTGNGDINPVQEYALMGARAGIYFDGWYLVARWTVAAETLVSESVILSSTEHLAKAHAYKEAPKYGVWVSAAMALLVNTLFLGLTAYGHAIVGAVLDSMSSTFGIVFGVVFLVWLPTMMIFSASLTLARVKARKARAYLAALVAEQEVTASHSEQYHAA